MKVAQSICLQINLYQEQRGEPLVFEMAPKSGGHKHRKGVRRRVSQSEQTAPPHWSR